MDSLDLRIAILDLKESGRLSTQPTTEEVRVKLDLPADKLRSISMAFRKLEFEEKTPLKRVRNKPNIPAVYKVPARFPESVKMERRLRRRGFSVGQVKNMMRQAANAPDIVDKAIGKLLVKNVPVEKRGALGRAIREVIVAMHEEMTYDLVTRREIAEWIGESPKMHKSALENRIRGLVKFQNRSKERNS